MLKNKKAMKKVRVLSDPNEIEKAQDFLDDGDQEKWENRELGNTAENAVVLKANSMSFSREMEAKYGTLSFGGLLAAWRTSEEATLKDFAELLGISPQNLNDLEHGRRIPTPSRAAEIAKKLGLPEAPLIQLALRDSLYKNGFHYSVTLQAV